MSIIDIDINELVENGDPVSILEKHGVPPEESKWIARLLTQSTPSFFEPAPAGEEVDEYILKQVRVVAECIGPVFQQYQGHRDAALVRVFLLLHGADGACMQEARIKRPSYTTDEWYKHDIHWARGIVEILETEPGSLGKEFPEPLSVVPPEEMRFNEVVDWDKVYEIGMNQDSQLDWDNPHRLEYWMSRISLNLYKKHILEAFKELPTDLIGGVGLGILRILRQHPVLKGNGDLGRALIIGLIISELPPFYQECSTRVQEAPKDMVLRRLWMELAFMVFRKNNESDGLLEPTESIPEDERLRLVRAATETLGRIRPFLRGTDPNAVTESFDPDMVRVCVKVLVKFATPWTALKNLILALSALNVPAVAADLRYWKEKSRDAPPQPWSVIPEQIATVIHSLGQEEKNDSKLQKLREEFAQFALDRLKTKKQIPRDGNNGLKDQDFVEERPIWREAYVLAVRELRCNPRGKGHKTLYWLSQHDPNPDVRKTAKNVHRQVRHGIAMDPRRSPRVALFSAFWFLRQAHLQALGVSPDEIGAKRTLQKEVRRTSLKI